MPAKPNRTNERVLPQNIQAEESLLGALLLSRDAQDDILPELNVEDFVKPAHQYAFDAMRALHSLPLGAIDVVTVSDELRRSGLLAECGGDEWVQSLIGNVPAISNAGRYAKILTDASILRKLIMVSAEASDAAYDAPDQPIHLVHDLRGKLDTLEMSTNNRVMAMTGEDFMAEEPMPWNWVMPHVLERHNRLLITGGEGARKSMLIIQMAVMAAAGVHWWTETACPPVRVLVVDLELGKIETRRRAELFSVAADYGSANWRSRLSIYSRSEDIDITSRSGASWLASLVDQAQPDILFLSPIYRLTSGLAKPGDIGGEDAAKRAAFAIDKIRNRFNCAIVAETHAAKGDAGRGRDLRPFGSSVWTRWPEFGYGIVAQADNPTARDWVGWRGDRSPRNWPDYFLWSDQTGDWRMKAQFDNVPSWYNAGIKGNW
jgi:hypothetical protein